MKRYWPYVVGAGGGLFALVLLALSGVLGVGASSRPFALTEWFFHTAVRQSVTLRSLDMAVPPLEDDAMVRRAAGHYDLVCATCHGSPAGPRDAFARHLVPRPPGLVEQMGHWRPPARIFWTVKHGIARSAMPAWPDQLRDDEVWDMVAFLDRLPELDAADYDRLAGRGEGACARCHGPDGTGGSSGLPRLDIQSPAYLAAALSAYRDGERTSGTMRTVAHGLDDAAIAELAARYGRRTAAVGAGTGGARGAEIALRGIPDRKIPACEECHGAAARPDWPRLAGQDRAYIARQLRLFVTLGASRGGPHAEIMAEAAHGLDEADIDAVADWYGAADTASPGVASASE
jgi:cytochrome c553